ncbi:VOC family protein [Kineosporia babensis]|uniref:VOC family protein n=1 Tax=Kineosporia babensis TaxID=499548 RepID=A0A9X1NGR0_9ACTN|nr:VOC family protein [Kineosporia babensis]MCD5313730.1 VOC family protein [Kineosporia babensis]
MSHHVDGGSGAFHLAAAPGVSRVVRMGFRMDAVTVVVADLGKSTAFYQRLGCTFEPGGHPGAAIADLGGLRLLLYTEDLLRELDWDIDQDAPRTGVTLGIRCDTAAELDELYAWLDEDGYGFREPLDAPWARRHATVQDPDGTHIDLYAPLP